MKGIKLAERFFGEYRELFLTPDTEPYISVGLVGNGSECFGFDDEISRDHDFGAGFCLWVDDHIYPEVKDRLEKAYLSLPKSYLGFEGSQSSLLCEKRRGVFSCSEFYKSIIGIGYAPKTYAEWLAIPDHALASASNGRVFTDSATDFTYVRNKLINGVPNDVFFKKISSAVIMMAQSGQYNFSRCLKHGEQGAARLALNEFVMNTARCIYYLNKKFPPYYKWVFKGMEGLDFGSEIKERLEVLLTLPSDKAEAEIELISSVLLSELTARGITEGSESYLEPHAIRIAERIKAPYLRGLHIMEG